MADGVAARPVAQGERFEALDVLRGVALLGIFAMNVMVFAMPLAAYSNPTVFLPYEGANRAAYWVTHTLFDLKMMALFSMLFGAGVVLWSRKAEGPGGVKRARALWFRRMAWLLVLGMIHAWLIWEGDILVSYALCGMITLWWLRRMPVGWMLVAAGGFFAVHLLTLGLQGFQVWMLLSPSDAAVSLREQIPEESRRAAMEGIGPFFAPTEEDLASQLGALRGSWPETFAHRAEMTAYMQIQGIPFWLFWRCSAMMLLGAALTKCGVLTGAREAGFYARLALAGYACGLPLVVGGILFNEFRGFDPALLAGPGMLFNAVGSVGVALGHVGLVVWAFRRGWLAGLWRGLARAGQMALSNYLAQSVLASLAFYGFGFGLAGELGRPGQMLFVVFVWVVQVLWSAAWLERHRYGPVEWLWRSLTYWRWQPLRREARTPVEAGPAPL